MHKLLEKLKEEFFAILPPTIFFFVALHILTFIRVLMARGSHFEPLSTMSIAIASLILGKAGIDRGHAAAHQSLSPEHRRQCSVGPKHNFLWSASLHICERYLGSHCDFHNRHKQTSFLSLG